MHTQLSAPGHDGYLDKRIKGVSSPTRSATYDPFSSPVLKSNLTHTGTFVLFKIICMASQALIYFCGKQCANSNKPHQ